MNAFATVIGPGRRNTKSYIFAPTDQTARNKTRTSIGGRIFFISMFSTFQIYH